MFGKIFGALFSNPLGFLFNPVQSVMNYAMQQRLLDSLQQPNGMMGNMPGSYAGNAVAGAAAVDGMRRGFESQAVGTLADSGNFNALDLNRDKFIDSNELAAASRNDGNLYSEEQIAAANTYRSDQSLFDHTENNGDGDLDGRLGQQDFYSQRQYLANNPWGYKANT